MTARESKPKPLSASQRYALRMILAQRTPPRVETLCSEYFIATPTLRNLLRRGFIAAAFAGGDNTPEMHQLVGDLFTIVTLTPTGRVAAEAADKAHDAAVTERLRQQRGHGLDVQPPGPARPREIERCTACPLSRGGFEWSPICDADPGKPRGLPKGHDPDGPPPTWCPLPITLTRKPRGAS